MFKLSCSALLRLQGENNNGWQSIIDGILAKSVHERAFKSKINTENYKKNEIRDLEKVICSKNFVTKSIS